MAFLEELGASFLFYLVIFVVIALVVVAVSSLRAKSKQKGFRKYLAEHFPSLKEDEPMLMAKTRSKQAKPDIALLVDDEKEQVIILQNPSGKQITHKVYRLSALTALNRRHQMISRGFAPKTWSYEESLELVFNNAIHYHFFLENISNKHGTDSGADAVREMFNPWVKKLSVYLPKKEPTA